MPNFTTGAVVSPLGSYAGYLLLTSGNFWLAIAFLVLTSVYLCIALATLCRYTINYRRNHDRT